MYQTEVTLARQQYKFGWAIYVSRLLDGRRQILHQVDGGVQTWDDYSPNVDAEPTFLLDEQALELLVAEYLRQEPPSPDVTDELRDARDDARMVRDRLLTLVEGGHGS